MRKQEKQDVAARLRKLVDRFAQGNRSQFARMAGVSPTAVAKWLDNKALPTMSALLRIQQKTQVDFHWLLTGRHAPPSSAQLVIEQMPGQIGDRADTGKIIRDQWMSDKYLPIPLIEGEISAGSGRDITTEDIVDFAIIYADWCKDPESVRCIRVKGDSMTPILSSGSIVAIDLSQNDPRKLDGKMAAFRAPSGGASIKWCKVVEDGLIVGYPENKESIGADALLVYRDEEIDNCIIGKIVWWWGRPQA